MTRNAILPRWSPVGVVLTIVLSTPVPLIGQAGVLLGGQVQTIAVDPRDATNIYLGTATGGVFKSTDRGSTWASVTTENFSRFVRDLAIDPAQSTTLYAATGGLNGGVFKTVDGAATWTRVNAGIPTNNVTAVAIDPANGSTVYAGTSVGMFKSLDGGASWAAITSGLPAPAVQAVSIDAASAATLYV